MAAGAAGKGAAAAESCPRGICVSWWAESQPVALHPCRPGGAEDGQQCCAAMQAVPASGGSWLTHSGKSLL